MHRNPLAIAALPLLLPNPAGGGGGRAPAAEIVLRFTGSKLGEATRGREEGGLSAEARISTPGAVLAVGRDLVDADVEQDGPFAVRVEVPGGWDVAAPWPRAEDGSFRAADGGSLRDNYLLAGRLRRSSREARGVRVEVVAPARSSVRVGDWCETAASLCDALEASLGPSPGERLLVVAGEADRSSGVAGSARRHSLLLAIPPGADAGEVEEVLAHEMAHLFLAFPFEADARWAREGFAEFFAGVARDRAQGAGSLPSLRALAEALEAWFAAGRRSGRTLAEASAAFHADALAREETYAGGHVVAALLDEVLRAVGGLAPIARGLDGDRSVSASDVREAVRRAGGPEAVSLLDRLVAGRVDLALLEAFPPSLEVEARSSLDRRLGWRFAPGARPLVAIVETGSAAARAGASAGEVVESFDGKPVRTVADLLRRRGEARGPEFRIGVRRGGVAVSLSGAYEERTRFRVRRSRPEGR